MPNTWGNRPPILETNCLEKLDDFVDEFLHQSIKAKRPKTIDKGRWNSDKNYCDTFACELLSLALDDYNDTHDDDDDEQEFRYSSWTFYAYKPLRLAGLMTWTANEDKGRGYVLGPIMVPGRESESTILIEKAVNLSEEAGFEGRVICMQYVTAGGIVIDPGKSGDKWVKMDGEWRSLDGLLQQADRRLLDYEIGGARLHPSIRRSLLGPNVSRRG